MNRQKPDESLKPTSTQLSEILRLSIAERIQLAEDIWDSITAFPEAIHLTDA